MAKEVHGGRRVLRWVGRIALGLVALIAVVIIGGVIFINTPAGRETLRVQAQKILDNTFTGGATIGEIDGDPLRELKIQRLVINGPDKKPAITIGSLHVKIKLFDLIKHDVQLTEVAADDVDIAVKRDGSGNFELASLLKPSDPPPDPNAKSKWNLEFPAVAIHDAHVMVDTGNPDAQVVDLDNLTIDAGARIMTSGKKSAKLDLSAIWRQRNVPVSIKLAFADNGELMTVPAMSVAVGGVGVTGQNVEVVLRDGRAPGFGGTLSVVASRDAVAHLIPRIELPADLSLAVQATRTGEGPSPVTLFATVGPTPIYAQLTADLDAKHAIGKIMTGDFDLASLTAGKVAATAGLTAELDAQVGAPGELPTATVTIEGRGTYAGMPPAKFMARIDTKGQHVATMVDVSGPARATLTAELERAADLITLQHATLIASTKDPSRSSGGKAPVHGTLDVALTAHGTFGGTAPPNVAVAGTVVGRKLRMAAASIGSLDVAIDAAQLPGQPRGKASVRASGIQNGTMWLGSLAVDAATRSDGKIAVNVTSHPKQNPWLVELAALITPPGESQAQDTTTIDLVHHHVRMGNSADWVGSSGKVIIGPQVIDLQRLTSASKDGQIAVSGSFTKAGPRAGDLVAKLGVKHFGLDMLGKGYVGIIAADVDVARTTGRWVGKINLDGSAVSLQQAAPPLDLSAKIAARPEQVTINVTAANPHLGQIALDADLAAPARLEDVAAWKAKGRAVIRKATLAVKGLQVPHLAALAGQDVLIAGQIDGQLDATATTVGAAFHLRGLQAPQLRGIKSTDADFEIVQTSPTELTPKLTLTVSDVGQAVAQAQINVPERMLDPAAWKREGLKALRGASVKTSDIAFDPAMFARFGVDSTLRGKANAEITVLPALSAVTLKANVTGLRGTPIAKPVDVQLTANADMKSATANIAMQSEGKPLTLLKIAGSIPVSIETLRTHPQGFAVLPVTATVELPQTSAPVLLNAFGRTEVTDGTFDGKIAVAGTIGKPTVQAHFVGANLAVPPGLGGRPIKTVKNLTIDGGWDGEVGKLTLSGLEDNGGKLSVIAQGNPAQLAAATATVTATAFDMGPLMAFAPGPAGGASGTLDANVNVKGFDPRTAQIRGELHLKNSRLPIAPALGTLRNAQIDIAIGQHEIKIGTSGKLGAGTVKLDGSIALDGVALSGGKATITLRKVSPLGAVQPEISADVDAKLARKGTQWTADITVNHGFAKVSTSGGEKLKQVGAPIDLTVGAKPKVVPPVPGAVPPAPPQPIIVANITINPVNVDSEQFRTTLSGKLKMTADVDAIGMVGTIHADGGDVDLFDRRYRIDKAGVTFDGTIDPLLDVRISHDFTDVTTVTEVHGRASKPELQLSAEPGTFTQAQLLGFLLGGEPNGAPDSASAQDKAAGAGESFIANQIGGYIKKALPFALDTLKYEAASADSSAAITVGSWITHTLYIAFTQHLEALPDENQDQGTLEYWFTRRLDLETTVGDRGYDGIDMLWRKRF